ncbi:MAG: sensor histidine kinase [Syntrophomonadaceae bacterium]|jgi:two-component system phosphate regulon sensor histidine kinase PhoR
MDSSIDQRKIQAILTSLVEGVIIFDIEGRVIVANHIAEKIFHTTRGTLIGKTMEEISPSDDELVAMVEETLLSGKETFAETMLGTHSQVYRVLVRPIKNDQGRLEGTVVVFHDITDIRNFAQVRSEFAGNVSHELRTPLTSIKGFVETLLDGAMANAGTCRRFLAIIDAETDRLSRLIEDLLTLASIESKEKIIQPKPVRVARSIRTVINMLGPQISEKELMVKFIYPPNMPSIHADEDLLGQVLINLLDNAIKYTPQGGLIVIRCKRRESRIIITVTDTGLGIPEDSIPRVFERFYRVDKARTRSQGGTGLGLSIVKHIVESHGGQVFVKSEVGKGSTFGVCFLTV